MGNYLYTAGGTDFEGQLEIPDAETGRHPCVLVAHAWDGPNAYFDRMAAGLAREGFAAFAIDVYGKGRRGKIDGDNSHLMNPLLADRALLRERLRAALNEMRGHPAVDPGRVAILGHCFGGLCALDLARANPEGLRGAVSVHGLLHSPELDSESAPMAASVLVLHGWEDPHAKPPDVLRFAAEMTARRTDWQVHVYGHAKHAFTFEGADLPELGIKYDEAAHRRSARAVLAFLREVLN